MIPKGTLAAAASNSPSVVRVEVNEIRHAVAVANATNCNSKLGDVSWQLLYEDLYW